MKIRSRYSERYRVALDTGTESFVQQQFAQETDIHYILEKFTRTGTLPVVTEKPMYGDFSNVQDFQEAQNLIARTKEYFDALPSDIRARFANDPREFLEFVNDPDNEAEAIELGILQKAESKPPVDVSEPQQGSDIKQPQTPAQTPVFGSEPVAP